MLSKYLLYSEERLIEVEISEHLYAYSGALSKPLTYGIKYASPFEKSRSGKSSFPIVIFCDLSVNTAAYICSSERDGWTYSEVIASSVG